MASSRLELEERHPESVSDIRRHACTPQLVIDEIVECPICNGEGRIGEN